MDAFFTIDVSRFSRPQAVPAARETPDLDEHFWSQVDVRGESDCWVWRGRVDRKGYGRFYADGKDVLVHKHVGEAPCPRHKLCCNPRHTRRQAKDAVRESGEVRVTRLEPSNPEPSAPDFASNSTRTAPDSTRTPGLGVYMNYSKYREELRSSSSRDTQVSTQVSTYRDPAIEAPASSPSPDLVLSPVDIAEASNVQASGLVEAVRESGTRTSNSTSNSNFPDGWAKYKIESIRWLGPKRAPLAETALDREVTHVNPYEIAMRPRKTGVFVDDDGRVIYVDLEPPHGTTAKAWYPKDQSRVDSAIARGAFGAAAKVEELPDTEEPVPCEGGGYAETPDNSDVFKHAGAWSQKDADSGKPVFYSSNDTNIYSGLNFAYAEEALRRFAAQKPALHYHPLVGPYPVPMWAEQIADSVCGEHYWWVEMKTGQILEERLRAVPPFGLVRGYVMASLAQEHDPTEGAQRFGYGITKPAAYLAAVITKVGGRAVEDPATLRPKTLPIYADGLETPKYDEAFAEEEGSFPLGSEPTDTQCAF